MHTYIQIICIYSYIVYTYVHIIQCVCVCKDGCILLEGITTDNFTRKTASAILAGLLLKWQPGKKFQGLSTSTH